MDFLKAILCFVVIVGLALLLGKLDHKKHPELTTYTWVGAIILLLAMRFFL